MKRHPRNEGFSLIELSIGLLILGLIMGAAMQVYTNYRINKLRSDTVGASATIDSAIQNYYVVNGYYPCPADRTLLPSDANYGLGLRDAANDCLIPAALAPGTCATNNGICRAVGRDADSNGTGDPVYIGAIPFQDLKIPGDNNLDGWGRQFVYAVTASMIKSKTGFNNTYGAITVNDFDEDNYKAGISVPIARDDNPYQYVIISFGEDGYGAYTRDGKLYRACSTETPLPSDAINCQNTATFQALAHGQGFSRPRNARHYDDFVVATRSVQNEIWDRSGTAGDIVPSARIGIDTPDVSRRILSDALTTMDDDKKFADDPDTDLDDRFYDKNITLDVAGDMGATQVNANKLCDATNTNCYAPGDIGGSTPKISCTSVPGSVYGTAMRGIANGAADCTPPAIPVNSGTCPAGQFISGFSGGTPICN